MLTGKNAKTPGRNRTKSISRGECIVESEMSGKNSGLKHLEA